jgi:hypothetical protein
MKDADEDQTDDPFTDFTPPKEEDEIEPEPAPSNDERPLDDDNEADDVPDEERPVKLDEDDSAG